MSKQHEQRGYVNAGLHARGQVQCARCLCRYARCLRDPARSMRQPEVTASAVCRCIGLQCRHDRVLCTGQSIHASTGTALQLRTFSYLAVQVPVQPGSTAIQLIVLAKQLVSTALPPWIFTALPSSKQLLPQTTLLGEPPAGHSDLPRPLPASRLRAAQSSPPSCYGGRWMEHSHRCHGQADIQGTCVGATSWGDVQHVRHTCHGDTGCRAAIGCTMHSCV